MRVVRESSSQPLTIDTRRNQLGAGGEGTVYSVGGGLVAKIYKEPQSRREKILAMLANPPAAEIHATWATEPASCQLASR